MIAINGLHILLTYQCTYECDHCFVWGSPFQTGTFSLNQLEDVFQQAAQCQSIEEIYFEGGEPCLYHPLLIAAVRRAHQLGFKTGIVSNAYWAKNETDAALWLHPLKEAGLNSLDVSSDLFHGSQMDNPEAANAVHTADRLGIQISTIQIEPPSTYRDPQAVGTKLGVWSERELKGDTPRVLEWDATASLPRAGEAQVQVRWESGTHPFYVRSVELLRDGRQVSQIAFPGPLKKSNDVAVGWLSTGIHHPGSRYTLRVTLQGTKDGASAGSVWIMQPPGSATKTAHP